MGSSYHAPFPLRKKPRLEFWSPVQENIVQEHHHRAVLPGGALKPVMYSLPSLCGNEKEASMQPEGGLVTLEEVSVYFTEEEWALLDPDQRRLHKEVMEENRQNVASLEEALLVAKPDSTSKLQGNSNLFFQDLDERERSAEPDCPQNKECLQCGKSFAESIDVTTHQCTYTGEKPYTCLECGKSFAQRTQLTAHQRIHTGEEPYKCLDCEKSFDQCGTLTSHQQIHTGEKPYKCLGCGKSFAWSKDVTTNQRTHTEENPYKCLECGKRFAQSTQLTSHQQIHIGEKPYKCPVCGKSFGYSANLIIHQCIHPGEKPYKCLECGKNFAPKWRRRTSPAPLPFTSLASGDSKRVGKALFADAGAGESPPTQVLEAEAGPGQGPAAEAPLPPAVETQQWEEGKHEESLEVDAGNMSFPSLTLTLGTRRMLERPAIGGTSPAFSEASSRPLTAMQEKRMPEEESVEATSLPLQLQPSLTAKPGHGEPSVSTSAEASPGEPKHAASARRGAPISSDVWEHFQRLEDRRFAQCKHCRAQISRGRDVNHLSTSGMRNHVKRQHQVVLLRGESSGGTTQLPTYQQEAGFSGALPPQFPVGQGQQASLMEMLDMQGTSVPREGIQRATRRITRLIMDMIAIDGQPFSVVDDFGFRGLLHDAYPWYTIPARTTLSRTMMPSLYRAARDHVKAQLSQVAGRTVHFTSDIWTCPITQRAYLSLTAHWWQPEDLQGGGGMPSIRQGWMGDRRAGYCKALLHAEVLDVSHTAESIAATLRRALEDWVGEGNITVGCMVTDGGANMKAAVAQLGHKHIYCVAHKVHLLVKDALGMGSSQESQDPATHELQDLLQKCQRLTSHFSRSVKSTHELRQKQAGTGVPEHRLVTDVATRWDSTCAMLECLVEQQAALQAWLSESDTWRQVGEFSQEDWLTISQTVEVLKPFKDFTVAVSSDTMTLGLVIPLVHTLQSAMASFVDPDAPRADLVPGVCALVTRLQQGITSHLQPLIEKEPYLLATMCDPRIKGIFAERAGNLASTRDALCLRVRRRQAKRGLLRAEGPGGWPSSAGPPPTPSQQAPPAATVGMFREMEMLQRALGPFGNVKRMSQDTAEAVVRDYLAEPCELLTTDPLNYWAKKEVVWPDLSLEAQSLLSCPPMSVESERVFSYASDMVSSHCTRLLPWRVEQLIFLKVNMRLFDFSAVDFQNE